MPALVSVFKLTYLSVPQMITFRFLQLSIQISCQNFLLPNELKYIEILNTTSSLIHLTGSKAPHHLQ